MTLSGRNTFFKVGILLCAFFNILVITISFITAPNQEAAQSLPPINSYYAVHAAMVFTALFSFIVMLIIHSYFERTPTPEILYIAIFIISFSFEAFRLFLPLHIIYVFPFFQLRVTTRILLFARFFGLFSLFTAGLLAAGLKIQKNRTAIFVLIVVSLVISLGIPVSTHSWNTSFNLNTGYTAMFRVIELVVLVTTMISFYIAAKIRGSREYVYAAVGSMLALIGRNMLLGTDNYMGVIQGIILLSLGTWFLCSKIHKIHLWL
jgi:hypothetical protein